MSKRIRWSPRLKLVDATPRRKRDWLGLFLTILASIAGGTLGWEIARRLSQ